MLLRMSSLFGRTLREDPAGADLPSHRLLVRAGYVRRAAPGGYTWLPLGKRVLDRVTAVVREEMAAIGAQEVSFPALLPAEPYRRSGRWDAYGADMFRLRDRRDAEFLLAPTHEEMFAALVGDVCASYRDYPVILYQVQSKYRDEQRPRGGLLRGREFLMKDSYSFDLDDAGLDRAYAAHRAAYQRILDRLGVAYTIVAAHSGAMGGSGSEEFLATSPNGEDSFVACAACGYAANVEAVTTTAPPAADPAAHPDSQVLDTPDTPTIASLVDVINARVAGGRTDWTAAQTLKNVVLAVRAPGNGNTGGNAPDAPGDGNAGGGLRVGDAEILVVGVPGDREVDLKRVEAALYPATVTMFDDFAAVPDLVRGYIGPQVLAKLGVRYLVDPRVVAGTAWVTGANQPGRHAINVVCGRDFVPDGVIEAAGVREGDTCPACGRPDVVLRRGIEAGHIFRLGTRYTDVIGLDALGADGRPVRVRMGSYGIGVSRLVAVIAEQHHDEKGLAWPAAVAPVDVHVVATGAGQKDTAVRLAEWLSRYGLDVLLDDRDGVSAGVKFTDAELIGAPRVAVVGRRYAEGVVELRERDTGARDDVPADEIAARLTPPAAGAGTAAG